MRVIVIGGGASGMMAALTAAEGGNDVVLIEKNNKLGKKLFLTGKGRCNLTNACDMEELFENIVTNRKFLFSALYDFDNKMTMDFFVSKGLLIKTERGNRVFPSSDHSSDVIKTLQNELIKSGVIIKYETEVKEIITEDLAAKDMDSDSENQETKRKSGSNKKKNSKSGFNKKIIGVSLQNGTFLNADAIIMATGGCSYPSTGSDGLSFDIVRKMGIDVTPLYPALVPLNITEKYVADMSGLSLKNVNVRVICSEKVIYDGFGEMLFTHFGVSGPLILSASSFFNRKYFGQNAILSIDLKPAMSQQELDDRILRDFSGIMNKQFKNSLSALLPSAIIPSVIQKTGIDPDKKVNSVTKEEREKIVDVIKNYTLHIKESRGIDEAIITSGGVNVKEINPSTMESKTVMGLYFAGEMIDVDALTGGFNLQIAWSTAHLAGLLGRKS